MQKQVGYQIESQCHVGTQKPVQHAQGLATPDAFPEVGRHHERDDNEEDACGVGERGTPVPGDIIEGIAIQDLEKSHGADRHTYPTRYFLAHTLTSLSSNWGMKMSVLSKQSSSFLSSMTLLPSFSLVIHVPPTDRNAANCCWVFRASLRPWPRSGGPARG